MSSGDPICRICGRRMVEHKAPCTGTANPDQSYGDWDTKSPYTELFEICEELMRERDEARQWARRMKAERDEAYELCDIQSANIKRFVDDIARLNNDNHLLRQALRRRSGYQKNGA